MPRGVGNDEQEHAHHGGKEDIKVAATLRRGAETGEDITRILLA